MDNTKEMILSQMSQEFRKLFAKIPFAGLEEIRFRVGRPICLYYANALFFLSPSGLCQKEADALFTSRDKLSDLVAGFCNHSIYAHQNEIKDGFITIQGGHRLGLSGKCVIKDDSICGMTGLSGINLRIAREYKGCARDLSRHLLVKNRVKNTILLAPPGCGKTTYLRDLARIFAQSFKVTVVDERSEIAGSSEGVPQFDIGLQTDVLDRFPKSAGMLLALRSLSPHIIITDELGDKEDLKAIRRVSDAGCALVVSMHAENLSELKKYKGEFIRYFDLAVCLDRQKGYPDVASIEKLR